MCIHLRQLAVFLFGRLVGYLLFAAIVWSIGASIPRSWVARSWIFGGIQLLLAAALLVYAAGWPHRRRAISDPSARLVQIGNPLRPRTSGALTLGFLTGINLCPPFLVAGVRAAQSDSLPVALLFFVFFFAGTAIWFVPFLSLGFVRRSPAFVTVARVTAALLACWYGFTGVSILLEKVVYG